MCLKTSKYNNICSHFISQELENGRNNVAKVDCHFPFIYYYYYYFGTFLSLRTTVSCASWVRSLFQQPSGIFSTTEGPNNQQNIELRKVKSKSQATSMATSMVLNINGLKVNVKKKKPNEILMKDS